MEQRRFLVRAASRVEAIELQRAYASVLVSAGLTPEYVIDARKPKGSPHWRIEIVTDAGDEGSDRWARAFEILAAMVNTHGQRRWPALTGKENSGAESNPHR